MATGRTVAKHTRVYVGGYDMSGMSRTIGPLEWSFDETDLTCITDPIKGVLPAHATFGLGTLNGVMDNTATTGLHVLMSAGAGSKYPVMVPVGIRAAPATGDPVYMGEFELTSYLSEGPYVNMQWGLPSVQSTILQSYRRPWGVLLHPSGAETAASTATGIDDNGAASALGGYMMYQIFAGNGTGVIKVQDAATNLNASFADLSGCTTGVMSFATPTAGVVAIGNTATVRQFLRFQVVMTTSTSVTFALAFVRNNL